MLGPDRWRVDRDGGFRRGLWLCPGSACGNAGAHDPLADSPSQARPPGEPVWHSLAMAVRYILQSPMLLGLLYVTMVMNALAFPTRQFIPAIGSEHLGSERGWSACWCSGEFWAARGRGHRLYAASPVPRTVFMGGSVIVLLMVTLFVWAPWYALAFALLALGGCGQAGFSTMQSTITMLVTPALRGRMMGLLSVCIGTSTPLGTLEIGVLALTFTVQHAIAVNALVGLLLLAPAVVLTPLVWQRIPQPPLMSPEDKSVSRQRGGSVASGDSTKERRMSNRDRDVAHLYHESTKLFYLDLSRKPPAHKRYRALLPLPLPTEVSPLAVPTLEAVAATVPAASSAHGFDLTTLAGLLFFSVGRSETRTFVGAGEVAFRAAASAGGLYPIEAYVVCGDLPGAGRGVSLLTG